MTLLRCCVVCVWAWASCAMAQGLPMLRVAVQSRAGVPDLVCAPGLAKPAAPAAVDPDPQEPPDVQEVEAQLGEWRPERGAAPSGPSQAAWPQARVGQPLRVAVWVTAISRRGFSLPNSCACCLGRVSRWPPSLWGPT